MPHIELSKINEVLSNLNNLTGRYKKVDESIPADYYKERGMGEEGESTVVLDVGLQPLFLKVIKHIDSYGSTEYVHSVQFVKAVEKTITAYEPLTQP